MNDGKHKTLYWSFGIAASQGQTKDIYIFNACFLIFCGLVVNTIQRIFTDKLCSDANRSRAMMRIWNGNDYETHFTENLLLPS